MYSKQSLVNEVIAMSNAISNKAVLSDAMRVRISGGTRVPLAR
jgi:hypothetical protein